MNILFVCSGNVSRSFLAERLLKHQLEKDGIEGIQVSSAGLYVYEGNPADRNMVAHLSDLGIRAPDHMARQLTREQTEWADLILVMEKDHAAAIKGAWPEAGEKLKHLGEYIPRGEDLDDIVDPYGLSPYHYRLAQSQIALAVKALLAAITSAQTVAKNAEDSDHRG